MVVAVVVVGASVVGVGVSAEEVEFVASSVAFPTSVTLVVKRWAHGSTVVVSGDVEVVVGVVVVGVVVVVVVGVVVATVVVQ